MSVNDEVVDPKHETERAAEAFRQLQEKLLEVWQTVEGGQPSPYVSLVIPSLSFDRQELAKIEGASFYEERLLFCLIRLRDPRASVVYVTSQPIHPEIVDYYLGLLRGVSQRSARQRLQLVSLADSSPEPLTRKILDRPRVVERLRQALRAFRHGYLTCFISTDLERRLALALGVPLNGVDPDLLWLGSKTGSREVFARAGVERPLGRERIGSRRQLVDGLADLAAHRPGIRRAVVKLNESFAGAGNALYTYPAGTPSAAALSAGLNGLRFTASEETPASFLGKLATMGGIVEELIEADEVRSPSAQLRIDPDGQVRLVSTHEQILGGATGQTYLGCRFPADGAYRGRIQEDALKIGSVLSEHGVVSRFAVDFLAWRDRGGDWRCAAIEINLRMGGTTAPFQALQFLTGGSLDIGSGHFLSARGRAKYYWATDNLRSTTYRGLLPEDFMDILAEYALQFDSGRETGAVFHMIGGLSQFGRIGVTCIGDSPDEAEEIHRRVVEVLEREGDRTPSRRAIALHPFDTPLPPIE